MGNEMTMTNETSETTTAAATSMRAKVIALRDALNASVLERSEEIDSLLVCALAGEHCVLIGPPGTAKSHLARSFAKAVSAIYFESLLTRFSTPEEIFGPFSLTGLQADRYTRAMAGRLPTAEVSFLDEIFKAGPGLLNSLLAALNERIVHDDGKAIRIPLRVCLAASNEYPASEETGALWDRFLVRHEVAPLAKLESQIALATGGTPTAPSAMLSLAEWDAACAEARAVKMTDSCAREYLKLVAAVRAAGSYVSDRRMLQAVGLLKAAAWLDGAEEVDSEHFDILAHVLWQSIDKRNDVRSIVANAKSPALAEAQRVFDAVMTATASNRASEDASQQARALSEIQRATKKLREIGQNTRKGSKSRARVKSMFDELSTIHKDLLTRATASFDAGEI